MTTPGALIAGRYRLRTRVANGGMGSVWEAEDEVLGRRVAVKMLLTQPGMSPADADTARSRVIREARITARLHHPHAVTIYDVVEHAGQPCLIMQFVPSRSLNAILQDRGVLPEQLTARIGAELASALTAAHLAGIVHRDIKPSNVLITDDGSARLTDFGISHAAGDVNLTSTGMVSGTPAYLAPEVARGAPSGFPADVFSLGATLYATLEGMPPFGTDVNPMAILHRVASGQIVLPRRSGSLTPLLLHMLAPMPGNRPTMSDVARALASPAEGPAHPAAPARAVPSPTLQGLPAAAVPAGSPPAAGPSAAGPSAAGPSAAGPSAADSSAAGVSAAGSAAGSPAAGSQAASLPDPPGASPINHGARSISPGPEHRRPALVGAVVAIVVIGLLALGVALLTRRGSGNVAGTTGSTAPSAVSAGARTTPTGSQGRAANPLPGAPGSSAAARSSAGASGPAAQLPATSNRVAATSRSSSIPSGATTSVPKTSAPKTSVPRSTSSSSSSTTGTSTTSSSTSPTTSSAGTGAPTAAQLAAAVTDYYAQLPSGTDSGWAHLTNRFRQEIAGSRARYQSFWDGIESVSVSDVRGTAPGTVRARVTYRLKNGQDSVEDTTYQLVSSDGILKIDDQKS